MTKPKVMTKHSARSALAALAASALLWGAAPPAHADSTTVTDPAGDVWLDISGRSGAHTQGPSPETINGDIVSTQIWHNRRAMLVRMNFADLNWEPDWGFAHFHLVTPRLRGNVDLRIDQKNPAGNQRVQFWRRGVTKPQMMGCASVTHKVNYVENFIRIRVPLRCLWRPRWVSSSSYYSIGANLNDADLTIRATSDWLGKLTPDATNFWWGGQSPRVYAGGHLG